MCDRVLRYLKSIAVNLQLNAVPLGLTPLGLMQFSFVQMTWIFKISAISPRALTREFMVYSIRSSVYFCSLYLSEYKQDEIIATQLNIEPSY